MTLRFVDSFDHYVTADLTEKYTSTTGSVAISAGNGRRGTASVRAPNASGSAANVSKTLDAQATWIVGAAFKFNILPDGDNPIIELFDGATLHVALQLRADGTLRIVRSTTQLGVTTFALSVGIYYYIEFKAFINDTTGTVEVKVNGSSKLALTSQDTRNAGNASANVVTVGGGGAGSTVDTYDWDDLYICDDAGSTNNNFLGDCRVDAFFPTGAGNTAQLTRGGTDSGANWSQVEETAPNDDTDYNEHATVGNKDTYAMGNLSHTPTTIFGAVLLMHAKKDDAGAKSIAGVVRSGTTDFDGSTQAISTSGLYYFDVRETDPNTSAAWTAANINAMEAGMKVAA